MLMVIGIGVYTVRQVALNDAMKYIGYNMAIKNDKI